MQNYLNFLAQVVATVLAAVLPALMDSTITADEWINVVIVGLGAVAVAGAGNLPAGVWRYAKLIVSAAAAVAVYLQSAIADGHLNLSATQWVQLVIAALGSVGVVALRGPQVVPAVSTVQGKGQQ